MSLKIHFLNVGHGDCTLIEFPSGRVAMIDINNSQALDENSERELAESFGYKDYAISKILGIDKLAEYKKKLTDPVVYYTDLFGKSSIFRFIATHPDMDHLTGLYRLAYEKQEGITINNFWDTNHSFTKSEDPKDWKNTAYDIRDWFMYQILRLSADKGPTVLRPRRSGKGVYYNRDDVGGKGDGIYVLSPTEEMEELADEERKKGNDQGANLLSYVLMVIYGKSKIILGGDADSKVWEDIYESYGENLKTNILKASHHGRDTGYYQPAVAVMNPEYAIVSVGKKPENDASNKYRNHTSKGVLSTRFCGNIVATCFSDGSIDISTQSQS